MQIKTCSYLLYVNGKNVRCDKPTKYKMIRDDDEVRRREYEPFCTEHTEIVNNTSLEEDKEWF